MYILILKIVNYLPTYVEARSDIRQRAYTPLMGSGMHDGGGPTSSAAGAQLAMAAGGRGMVPDGVLPRNATHIQSG